MATNGAEVIASELMTALLTGVDVTVPTINTADSEFQIPGDNTSDAYDVLLKLTNADLTTGAINGTGSFDKLMVGVAAQLQGEYDAGRITGAEYSKAYITLTQSALATSLQFLLGKDASYWQAVQAQTQAVIARVQLATVKAENARAQIEALTAKSNYALTKLKLATEDVQYGSLKYKLDNIDPLQVTQLTLQNSGITTSNLGLSINNDIASYNLTTTLPKQATILDNQALQIAEQTAQVTYTTVNLLPAQLAQITGETSKINYEVVNILPKQGGLLTEQTLQVTAQTDGVTKTNVGIDTANSIASYNLTTVLPKQQEILVEQLATAVVDKNTKSYNLTDILPAQKLNLQEQAEAQRAQTLDTRSDGVTAVAGSVGKQNALYAQQVISYQKDAELKAGKVFSDIWTVRKTVDEGTGLPAAFDTANIQSVMSKIMTSNGL